MVLAEKQTHRRVGSEVNSYLYGQITFNKRAKNIQWRKESLLNKWCWEYWKATRKRMKRDYCLSPHTKINSKWIKDLNIRPETIKCIEENIGTKFKELGLKEDFMNLTSKAREEKLKYINGTTTKETINKVKRQPSEWENIFANNASDKDQISQIHKELIQLNNNKKSNDPINMGRGPEQTLPPRGHINDHQLYEKILNIASY